MQKETDIFPLSKIRKVKGSRRLAREKVMQILMADELGEADVSAVFGHVFFRKFNFGDKEQKQHKLLTPDEITEIESDVPIEWNDEEIEFGRLLIAKVIEYKTDIQALISKFANNWDLDRIAIIDRLLMQIALTELLHFPEIPTKVSINEAIDIAKKYSTGRSSTFINGVLDSALDYLKTEGMIQKTGRGLQE